MQKRVEKILKGIWWFIKTVLVGLFTAGVPAMVGRLAWLRNIPDYQWILYMLASLGLTFFIFNQFLIIKKRIGDRPEKWSDKRVEKTVREWVDIPGFTYERMTPQRGIIFNISIKDKLERYINISKVSDSPGVINLMGRVKIQPPGPPLGTNEWGMLASKISIEMARHGIGYAFDGEQNKFEYIRLIDQVILDNSLTERFFRQRIFFVIRAIILVSAVTQQRISISGPALSIPPVPEPPPASKCGL